MSISATRIHRSVEGSTVREFYDLSFDSVTGGKISTGLSNILHASYSPGTSDDHGIVYKNYSDAGSTASRGDVYVDGVTSDDTGTLEVVGY